MSATEGSVRGVESNLEMFRNQSHTDEYDSGWVDGYAAAVWFLKNCVRWDDDDTN